MISLSRALMRMWVAVWLQRPTALRRIHRLRLRGLRSERMPVREHPRFSYGEAKWSKKWCETQM